MSSTLLVNLRDTDDRPIPLAHVRVSFNDEDSAAAYDDHLTDASGNVAFMFQPDGPKTVHVAPVGYEIGRVAFTLPRGDVLVTVAKTGEIIPPATGRLTRLRAASPLGFENAVGHRVFLAGASGFMLYRDHLDGTDIDPWLAMLRQDFGCNLVRVFGMCLNIPVNQGQRAFKPQDYGSRFYTELAPFFRRLEAHGMYGLFTEFPDNKLVMPDVNEQDRHHDQVGSALRDADNSLFELSNEVGAHDFNGWSSVDLQRFEKPAGIASVLSGYGDEFGADLPPGPHWDFGSYHTPRRYPGHILDCNAVNHPFVLKLNKGVLLGEPDRYGSRGNTNLDQARQSAGAARQSTLGIVFHSAQGRDGANTFDDETRRSAEVFFAALR